MYFYEHQLGKALILDEATNISVKDKNIDGWTMTTEELVKLNLEAKKNLKKY
jgi:hypothetical protein